MKDKSKPTPMKKTRCYRCGARITSPKAELGPECIDCKDGQQRFWPATMPGGFYPIPSGNPS